MTNFIENLRERLRDTAFSFFKGANSRESILQECMDSNFDRSGFGTPPRIVCAIILFERGDRDTARTLLTDHMVNSSDHAGHIEYVRGLMERMGLAS